jgi:hypothetical protein
VFLASATFPSHNGVLTISARVDSGQMDLQRGRQTGSIPLRDQEMSKIHCNFMLCF